MGRWCLPVLFLAEAGLASAWGNQTLSAVVLAELKVTPDEDPMVQEAQQSDQWVTKFLGLEKGNLCEVFGFDQNSSWWLSLQVLVSFLFLKLCVSSPCGGVRGSPAGAGPMHAAQGSSARDQSLEELESFADEMNKRLDVMETQTQMDMASNQSMGSAMQSSASSPDRQRDVQWLKDDLGGKLATMKDKWEKEKKQIDVAAGSVISPLGPMNDATLAVLYWAFQCILSCPVLFWIVYGMFAIPNLSMIPSRYNVFVYAFVNSGMLPTAVQAVIFLAASMNDPQFLLGSDAGSGPSGGLGSQGIAGSLVSTRASSDSEGGLLDAQGSMSGARRAAPHSEPSAQARQTMELTVLMAPMVAPLALVLFSHTVPFMLYFLWVTLLVVLGAFAFVWLVWRIELCIFQPGKGQAPRSIAVRLRARRRLEVLMFVCQFVVTLFIHMSVGSMVRVYAGDYHHGGYLEKLFEHILLSDVPEPVTCPWNSFVMWIDQLLRWI